MRVLQPAKGSVRLVSSNGPCLCSHCRRRAAQVQLTPELGTPTYSVLFKKDAYEVRRYEAYNVAETSMGAGAGPAAGTGFTELAGYIFGGNDAEKKMDMTTPVFSTGGGGAGGSRMQFVLESGVEPSAFPAPKSRDVERRSEAGGLRAVASFSGLPTDGEVRAPAHFLLARSVGWQIAAAPPVQHRPRLLLSDRAKRPRHVLIRHDSNRAQNVCARSGACVRTHP